jgi:hypothetical protein
MGWHTRTRVCVRGNRRGSSLGESVSKNINMFSGTDDSWDLEVRSSGSQKTAGAEK